MIKLTEKREITPYLWVRPDEDAVRRLARRPGRRSPMRLPAWRIARLISTARALQSCGFSAMADRAAGRATYIARVGAHDDLVLSVAISVWFATNMPTFSREELRI